MGNLCRGVVAWHLPDQHQRQRLPLLRAMVGFTLGLAIFRFAGYLDGLSAVAQDVLVVVVLVGIVAAAAFNPYD